MIANCGSGALAGFNIISDVGRQDHIGRYYVKVICESFLRIISLPILC